MSDVLLEHTAAAVGSMSLAALLGLSVTITRRPSDYDWAMIRAGTFLALAGDLLFRVVADDMARAFGLLGAASLVRYRSGLRNPSDASALFIAIALGMACGAGVYGLAIGGAVLVRVIGLGFAYAPGAGGGLDQLFEIEIRGRDADVLTAARQGFGTLGLEARLTEAEVKDNRKEDVGRGAWRWVFESRAPADSEAEIVRVLIDKGVTDVRVARKAWDGKS